MVVGVEVTFSHLSLVSQVGIPEVVALVVASLVVKVVPGVLLVNVVLVAAPLVVSLAPILLEIVSSLGTVAEAM